MDTYRDDTKKATPVLLGSKKNRCGHFLIIGFLRSDFIKLTAQFIK